MESMICNHCSCRYTMSRVPAEEYSRRQFSRTIATQVYFHRSVIVH